MAVIKPGKGNISAEKTDVVEVTVYLDNFMPIGSEENLIEIEVPKNLLDSFVRSKTDYGSTEEFLHEYTADETDNLVSYLLEHDALRTPDYVKHYYEAKSIAKEGLLKLSEEARREFISEESFILFSSSDELEAILSECTMSTLSDLLPQIVQAFDYEQRSFKEKMSSLLSSKKSVAVELPEETLAMLGLPSDASPQVIKDKLEHLHEFPEFYLQTAAGRVSIGFNTGDDYDYPQAYVALLPKGGSCQYELCLADIPAENRGDINLLLYSDPSSDQPTVEEIMSRDDVISDLRKRNDYRKENPNKAKQKPEAAR